MSNKRLTQAIRPFFSRSTTRPEECIQMWCLLLRVVILRLRAKVVRGGARAVDAARSLFLRLCYVVRCKYKYMARRERILPIHTSSEGDISIHWLCGLRSKGQASSNRSHDEEEGSLHSPVRWNEFRGILNDQVITRNVIIINFTFMVLWSRTFKKGTKSKTKWMWHHRDISLPNLIWTSVSINF